MKISDSELRTRMTLANKKMIQKFWAVWLAIIVVFFFCLVFKQTATAIAHWSAAYVPSVAKLTQDPTAIGNLPGTYFGVLAVLMPVFVIWLAWGEDPRMRWRYGKMQSGRGPVEFLLMLYLLGIPFCIFFLYVMYAAPIEMPAQPRLWGQHLVYLMLNTYLGLLVFGGVAAFGTALFGSVTLFYFLLPFAAIKNSLLKGKN